MRSPYRQIKRDLVDRQEVRRLAGPRLWHWLGAIAVEWTIIGTTIWICIAFPYWWLWVAGAFVIGTRQHALGVLAHEGSHHLVARSLFWNDLLSNYLSAYPLTFTVEGFRSTHLKHHWYLETPADPSKITIDHHPKEWTFPMTRWGLFGMVLRDLTALSQRSSASLLKYLWEIPGGRTIHLIRLALLHGAFIALAITTGHLWVYVLLWLLPLFTVAIACYRIRSIAEHSAIGPQEGRYTRTTVDSLIATRTTISSPILQFIFAPYNISYHVEHHLYPNVSVFRLPELHKRLRQNPTYVTTAHVTGGYGQLFRELTGLGPQNKSNVTPETAPHPTA